VAESRRHFYDDDENFSYDHADYAKYLFEPEKAAIEISDVEIIDPKFPKRKLAKLSKIEKLVYILITLVAVVFSFAIVYSITTVQKMTNENTLIKSKNDQMKESVDELQQKVNELLRSDRVKEIADKKGLYVIDENLKKVE